MRIFRGHTAGGNVCCRKNVSELTLEHAELEKANANLAARDSKFSDTRSPNTWLLARNLSELALFCSGHCYLSPSYKEEGPIFNCC